MRLIIIFLLFSATAFGQNKTVINIGEGSGSGSADCDCGVQIAKVTSDINFNSNPTLTDVTGLSADLEAGGMYVFEGVIFSIGAQGLGGCFGGGKASVSGTATITSLVWSGYLLDVEVRDHVMDDAYGTAFGNFGSIDHMAHYIDGTITVNVAGTLKLQYAQNTSCDGSTLQDGLLYAGSYLKVTKIN